MSLEIYNGALVVDEIFKRWYESIKSENMGAFITFVGTVRKEGEVDGLSFDIYEPLLEDWFNRWQDRVAKKGIKLFMAHSKGDVGVFESSYIAAVASRKRRDALEIIDEFVEDFKANAPIWKYDLINGKRVFAKDRSMPMDGAGILGEEND